MKLGVDFGSTNTILSTYDAVDDQVKTVSLGNAPYIPSVVTVNPDPEDYEESFGSSALDQTGMPGYRTYRAFKMLLVENNPDTLKKRGYSQEFTPGKIASMYLRHCLEAAMTVSSEKRIQNLTICVPEIWNSDMKSVDGRSVLRDIFRSVPAVEKLQIVSEPAAASALFAYNYQKKMKKPFAGHILLIDYGGGTLDITLTQVSCTEGGSMEIKVLSRTGAGENTDSSVGEAGIAYMEDIIRSALKRVNVVPDNPDELAITQDNLDRKFRNSVNNVAAVFDMDGIDDLQQLEQQRFAKLSYGKTLFTINYADLVRSYDKVIRPVLKKNLEYIRQEMVRLNVSARNIAQEDFKVACVGGFGSYYLVGRQVNEFLKISAKNPADTNIIQSKEDREYAISYGAALISAGVIGIRSVAPYSIGIAVKSGNKYCANLAFNARQEIEYNVPYYQCDKSGRIVVYLPGGSLKELMISFHQDKQDIQKVKIKDSFLRKLRGIVPSDYQFANVGFSLDANETLSVHINGYAIEDGTCSESRAITLSRFEDLLEPFVFNPDFIKEVDM